MAEAQVATQIPAREYETIYILRPDVAREGAEKVSTRLKEVVSREGGRLTLVETWGRRQLAYRVSRYRRGVYVYLKYVGQGALVAELERNLRMLDDVLKYQTVKLSDEVDLDALKVADEDVEFEAVEPPGDDEEDESLARSLGLEETPREPPPPREEAPAAAKPTEVAEAGEAGEAKAEDEAKAEVKDAQAEAGDAKDAQAEASDTKPSDTKASDAKDSDAKDSDAKDSDAKDSDAKEDQS